MTRPNWPVSSIWRCARLPEYVDHTVIKPMGRGRIDERPRAVARHDIVDAAIQSSKFKTISLKAARGGTACLGLPVRQNLRTEQR